MNTQPLRILFYGTPDFAVASLDILVRNGYNIAAVVTAPDKPAGRGLDLQQSPVKKYALGKNLNVLQPTNLKEPTFLEQLKNISPDLQIVVAFRMMPESVWSLPSLGTFNLHASLLPQYRGAAPINWAIINGEKETGVTTFFLKQEIDTGKIIYRAKVNIGENETAGELHDKLMNHGADLVLKTVRDIESGNYHTEEQTAFVKPADKLKAAPKIFKEDCKINWQKPATEIHNFIRGLSPYPAAWTELKSQSPPEEKEEIISLKVFRSEKEIAQHNFPLGLIQEISPSGGGGGRMVQVAVKEGFIHLLEVQLAGKKRMGIEEFLKGFSFDKWKIVLG